MHIMTKDGWRELPVRTVNHNRLEGVYRPVSMEEAEADNQLRASSFEKDVSKYIEGELSLEETFKAFRAPMYGAFGEEIR